GGIYFQKDDNDDEQFMTRLGESYNNSVPLQARCQFVVNQGGGMVLLNRMRRACQTYILERLGGDVGRGVVMDLKVFREGAGVGRSDSCVIYLGAPYTDRSVSEFVEDYLWPNIKDLVEDQFQPLGLNRLCEKPIWAINIPPSAVQKRVLKEDCCGSAGGLMGT